jgi:hypothetical protein
LYCFVFWNSETFLTPLCEGCGGLLSPIGKNKGCVSHHDLAIYIKKYLNAKEELRKSKYFTMQKYNLQKNPLKETKILQDIIITL